METKGADTASNRLDEESRVNAILEQLVPGEAVTVRAKEKLESSLYDRIPEIKVAGTHVGGSPDEVFTIEGFYNRREEVEARGQGLTMPFDCLFIDNPNAYTESQLLVRIPVHSIVGLELPPEAE